MSELNEIQQRYVDQLREKVRDQLHPNYDTDYNLYRWILSADNFSKTEGNIELAAKNLKNHLRYRKALKLDEIFISQDENPLFVERYYPKPQWHYLPSCNKYLECLEFGSLDMGGILHTLSSTEIITLNFYHFDSSLRLVNAREKETGRRSSIHTVLNLTGYDMNPWALMFATNGQLSQMIEIFTYEHYPELVSCYSMLNTPKWLLWPLKLIKAAMPKDFNNRFRFYDHRYKEGLLQDMTEEELPAQLGGTNPLSDALAPVLARRVDPSEYYQQKAHNDPPKSHLAHIQLHVGQRKVFPLRCQAGSTFSWFFTNDGDHDFGIFYAQENEEKAQKFISSQNDALDNLDMVHPRFRQAAKLVPEKGAIRCETNGTYYIIFHNKYTWIQKRNVYLKVAVDGKALERKFIMERTQSL